VKTAEMSPRRFTAEDWFAVAAVLGAKLPDNAGEDSINVLPVLLGENHASPLREATVHHSGNGKFAIRKGEWVFIDAATGDDNRARGEPQWLKDERGYTKHDQPGELFNLRDDLAERHNYYAEKPELVRELKTLLEKYKADGRSTPGAKQANDVELSRSPRAN
jgi:arylsulfatase A-like enzyme